MVLMPAIFEAKKIANNINCEKQRWLINFLSEYDLTTYILKMLPPETQRNNQK